MTTATLKTHGGRARHLLGALCSSGILLVTSAAVAEPARLQRVDQLVLAQMGNGSERNPPVSRAWRESYEVRARSHLLVAVPGHAIPDGQISSAVLYLYVKRLDQGAERLELRGHRGLNSVDRETLRGGWFLEADGVAAAKPSALAEPDADRPAMEFASWKEGDPVLKLDSRTAPGYQRVRIPPAWLHHWRSVGENRGVLFKLHGEGSGRLTAEVDGASHRPYLELSTVPQPQSVTETRVIANDGRFNATWPLNGSKVASRAGRTFVAYTRQDRRWATLWRDAAGTWRTGSVGGEPTPETPLLLMDAAGHLHIFANLPDKLKLRHYRSTRPLSVQSFDEGEDVVSGVSHFGGTIGPDGTLYVAYLEAGSYDIRIARRQPGAAEWTSIAVVKGDCTPVAQRCGHYPGIRVDRDNTVHLTYDIVRITDYVHTMVAYAAGRNRGERWFRSGGAPLKIPIAAGADEAVSESTETRLQGGQITLSRCGSIHLLYHRRRIGPDGQVSSEQEVVHARAKTGGWTRRVVGTGKASNSGALAADSAGRLSAIFEERGEIASYASRDDGKTWSGRRVLAIRPRAWPQTATLWFPSAPQVLLVGDPVQVVFTGIHEYAEIYFSMLRPETAAPAAACPTD